VELYLLYLYSPLCAHSNLYLSILAHKEMT
jgi:hypothetical protein